MVSAVPMPPLTVSPTVKPMKVSLPEPPVSESAPLPPVMVKPSVAVVWFVRVIVTPRVIAAALIASTLISCASSALLRSVVAVVEMVIVSKPSPPSTVSAPAKPTIVSLPASARIRSGPGVPGSRSALIVPLIAIVQFPLGRTSTYSEITYSPISSKLSQHSVNYKKYNKFVFFCKQKFVSIESFH